MAVVLFERLCSRNDVLRYF